MIWRRTVETIGVTPIRVSIDGFHNPRSVRYRLGRQSPEGFYRDSFNLSEFKSAVLDPLSPGGNLQYREAAFDHRTDSVVASPTKQATATAILLVDGVFLLQPELARYWDLSILLDVQFELSFQRMAVETVHLRTP
jgi:uridine kinase